MSERDYAPLSIACVRGLCEKIYEKRKFAGVEIEKYNSFLIISFLVRNYQRTYIYMVFLNVSES